MDKLELEANRCGYCGQTYNHFIKRKNDVPDVTGGVIMGNDVTKSLQALGAHYEKHLLQQMMKKKDE